MAVAYHKSPTIRGYAQGNDAARCYSGQGDTRQAREVSPQVSRPKVLIVDDDPNGRRTIAASLQQSCDIIAATDHCACMGPSRTESPDLVVLDVVTNRADGWETLRRIKAEWATPVMVVSVRRDVLARIHTLRLGADDFLTKPFDGAELAARVEAILRRYPFRRGRPGPLERGPLIIDQTELCATWKGLPLSLTRKEFQLLVILASVPGRVFGRDQLVELVWGSKRSVAERTVDTHMKNIRRQLRDGAPFVVTERGLGYRFVDPTVR